MVDGRFLRTILANWVGFTTPSGVLVLRKLGLLCSSSFGGEHDGPLWAALAWPYYRLSALAWPYDILHRGWEFRNLQYPADVLGALE